MSEVAQFGELRVGVAGLGFGAAVHVPTLQGVPGVRVVGLAGSSVERAARVAARLGVEQACGSVEHLLDLKLNAITLALPPDQVSRAVGLALSRGVAVLCEKPLGINLDEALELSRKGRGHVTAMDFQFAELSTFGRLKQIIRGGELGNPRHMQVVWLGESWAQRHQKWSWKTDATRGGGVINLLGSHLFFLAEWLLGPARTVWAQTNVSSPARFAPPGSIPAEDLVHCRIEHEGGVVWAATFGNANPGSAVHRWTVVCDQGTVTLENISGDTFGGFTLRVSGRKSDGEQMAEPRLNEDERFAPFRSLAVRFLNGVRNQHAVYPDFAVGAQVQRVDAAVRAGASSGQGQVLGGRAPGQTVSPIIAQQTSR